MKLQTLLNRIINNSIITYEGKRYISTLLSSILFTNQSLAELTAKKINDNFYFNLDEITSENERRTSGILYHFKQLETAKEVPGNELLIRFNSDGRYERDFKKAIETANNFRHEFIDHFADEQSIEVKSRTLSFLRVMIPEINQSDFLKFFYNELIVQQISLDFEITSFPDFYEKIKWYKRISPVAGLINIDYNPNS